MTAAIQHRRSGPEYRGQSRFFASPPRAPRHWNPRPEKRVAGRKTAPGIFLSATPKPHPEAAAQSLGTHQENWVFAYDFASGCAVDPNSGGTTSSTSSHGVTLVVGISGQGGGFIPAGPFGQVTPFAVGISVSWANGIQLGILQNAGTGLQVLPTYGGSVFAQLTDAGSLNALKGPGWNVGGSGGEGVVVGGDIVTGWANGGPSPGSYVGLQISAGGGGGFPFEGHSGVNYTGGITTGGGGGFSPGGGTFNGHGASGTW